ncbi:hypothetical protein N665_0101s0023 [Sinapis alba]|nr:hypothetical protein N665_0101s0023 [Sinapis alba]
MEVYINNMLVKSLNEKDHITHLQECFQRLNLHKMKLKPAKCQFAVATGEFLGSLSHTVESKLTPKKIDTLIKTDSPKNKLLAKLIKGEPMFLYIAVSARKVSGVLIKEECGEQKPIFYVSKTLLDSETRPYFQSHAIIFFTTYPLRTILHSLTQSGRIAKLEIELSEYDIEYQTTKLCKISMELPTKDITNKEPSSTWLLHVDGSSFKQGSGIGVRLKSPTRFPLFK